MEPKRALRETPLQKFKQIPLQKYNPKQSNAFLENGFNSNRVMTYKPVGEIHESPARKYNHNGA